MAILTLPATPGFKASRFGLVSNTQSFRSPLSGTVQTLERTGARWRAEYQLPPMKRAQAAVWQGFLAQLRGGAGRFYGFDADAKAPRGSAAVQNTSGSNVLRNSVGAGAVAGVIGSGGSAPQYWSFSSANGLLREVLGSGIEGGQSYLEVRFSGTPTANYAFVVFETATQVVVAEGEQLTGSFFYKLAGGSMTNISAVQQLFDQCQSNGVSNGGQYSNVGTVDGIWRRAVSTKTVANATPDTTRLRNGLLFALTIGNPVDITLRIGSPQLERAGSVSAYVPTSGAARTRGAGARIDGAGQNGSTLKSWNWQANSTGVLRAGDYFALETQAGRSLHLVTADASSDADGRALLTFEPPLRGSPPDDTAIILSLPACVMGLVDDSVQWESNAHGIVTISFAAEERF